MSTARCFRYAWGAYDAHCFSAEIGEERFFPQPGSLDAFITEHYWGYAQGRGSTLAYRVEHPQWLCSPVTSCDINLDFAAVYGSDFGFLNEQTPHSVQYARGSRVRVSFPRRG